MGIRATDPKRCAFLWPAVSISDWVLCLVSGWEARNHLRSFMASDVQFGDKQETQSETPHPSRERRRPVTGPEGGLCQPTCVVSWAVTDLSTCCLGMESGRAGGCSLRAEREAPRQIAGWCLGRHALSGAVVQPQVTLLPNVWTELALM